MYINDFGKSSIQEWVDVNELNNLSLNLERAKMAKYNF